MKSSVFQLHTFHRKFNSKATKIYHISPLHTVCVYILYAFQPQPSPYFHFPICRCCAKAALWQKELQIALLQSTEFHNSLRDLSAWLSKTEGQIRAEEPVDFGASRTSLAHKYSTFRVSDSEESLFWDSVLWGWVSF